MKNYRELAVKYVKINKKRSTLTVIGAALSVIVIFLILNLAWSYVLNERSSIREENDYEIVIMTENREDIVEILSDENIESAGTGSYYDEWYEEETEDGRIISPGKTYRNALFINTVNPYKMEEFREYFEETYGITTYINEELASYYFQDLDGNLVLVMALLLLLITFIFATFGVGIVRNAIQLSTLEQIKDYGNLRCIGASKSELKTFIYIESMILESMGIILGIILGTVVSMIIGHFAGFSAGFHLIALIPILICFYGDLYFAMQENAKLVLKITPIEAIRGEYRIHSEKLKVRRKNIFGKLFGVEGDYAYKNVIRNPDRFLKTVFTISLGVAAVVATLWIYSGIRNYRKIMDDIYQYYQLYIYADSEIWNTSSDVQSSLSKDGLQELSDRNWVTEAKKLYQSSVLVNDFENIYESLDDDYATETLWGVSKIESYEFYKNPYLIEGVDDEEEAVRHQKIASINYGEITCKGYDEEDYARLSDALIEGTTDLSENGILLVNGTTTEKNEYDSLGIQYTHVNITTYDVGDTVDIVNMQSLRELVIQKLEEAGDIDSQEKYCIMADCWQELIEEGDYKTYTIEGILDYDANYNDDSSFISFILPLDGYFELTGTDEEWVSGMMYHIDSYSEKTADEWYNIYYSYFADMDKATGISINASYYFSLFDNLGDMDNYIIAVLLGVIFIFTMNILNIFNTTAAGLYSRRREFAELRVIGVSKKGLMKMVMMESAITSVVSDIIGIVVGVGIGVYLSQYIYMLLGATYSFPWLPILIGCVVSFLLLAAAAYFPMRRLQPQLAADLTASGE